ncbi:hypothetical protein EYF80_048324 [Liparis tanakae]|uniref:Uncharacterized protein n=1 Tax=Liparis tanakae TaxID=230148 RepID=A0A4Z2FK45_9TELE|nr:hypothetical protein EYF80_048324 [Liparis tanakae]
MGISWKGAANREGAGAPRGQVLAHTDEANARSHTREVQRRELPIKGPSPAPPPPTSWICYSLAERQMGFHPSHQQMRKAESCQTFSTPPLSAHQQPMNRRFSLPLPEMIRCPESPVVKRHGFIRAPGRNDDPSARLTFGERGRRLSRRRPTVLRSLLMAKQEMEAMKTNRT